MPDLTPTPATEWRKQSTDGELYRLPGSGHVARLRRPSLMALATRPGVIPNPLGDAVLRFLATTPDAKTDAQQIDAYRTNARAFEEIAALCLVEPHLILDRTPNYDAGEIGTDDLSDRDYSFIVFTLTQGAASDVAPFRLAPALDPERPDAR